MPSFCSGKERERGHLSFKDGVTSDEFPSREEKLPNSSMSHPKNAGSAQLSDTINSRRFFTSASTRGQIHFDCEHPPLSIPL